MSEQIKRGVPKDAMRVAFEAWAEEYGHDIARSPWNGHYYGQDECNDSWAAWQAALATQPQAPQGGPNDWIEWSGGPYSGNAAEMIEVKLRDNSLSDGEARPAAEWCWVHDKNASDCDIVAYRLAPTETPEAGK
jgi:hypothetical protein